MASAQVAPYGSWKSPIKSGDIASATLRLGWTAYDEAGNLYWLEGRPAEGGRQVVVCRDQQGKLTDVVPAGFNVRTLVHEYGGGSYAVNSTAVYFANFADQCAYRAERGKEPIALTPPGKFRYADPAIDENRNRSIWVREDHSVAGAEATNTLVLLSTDKLNQDGGRILAEGNNFYSTPRISADGKYLAWLTWNHPNMPWDGTELWVAELAENSDLRNKRCIAGGADESVFQPEWSQDGTLYFVADKSKWWNIYAVRDPLSGGKPFNLAPIEKEFGMPQWVFGMSTYVPLGKDRLVCAYNDRGTWQLARIDVDLQKQQGRLQELDVSYTDFSFFSGDGKSKVAMCASSPTQPQAVIEFDTVSGAVTVARKSIESAPDPGYVSVAETIEFPTADGKTAYAYLYKPKNPDYQAPAGTLPPLLLKSHGGPTGATSSSLSTSIQYWTSRGFAVVDVNYRGSTGFGRDYRNLLRLSWGVVDVEDCENAARHLVKLGVVDPKRLAITGGSAGGYTTLCALTFGDVFHAGASHFGIGDLEALQADTHKFEARYNDTILGPYEGERKKVYYDRSPINFVDRLQCPVIFFQGLEDKAVPPSQAEAMVAALKKKRLPVAYIAYEGEQHGFRKSENIKRTLDAEFYFYSRIFEFQPADEIEPVEIVNLEAVATKV